MDILYEIESMTYMSNTAEFNNKIDQMIEEVKDKEMLKLIDYFLYQLMDNHELAGSDYAMLMGIGEWIRSGDTTTRKQKYYTLMTVIENWNQMDLFK